MLQGMIALADSVQHCSMNNHACLLPRWKQSVVAEVVWRVFWV